MYIAAKKKKCMSVLWYMLFSRFPNTFQKKKLLAQRKRLPKEGPGARRKAELLLAPKIGVY